MTQRREAMVEQQIRARGVRDGTVLAAMRKVPRHRFVPVDLVDDAYADTPLPIGHHQTISQPYIVAYMSEILAPTRAHKVLEVGTGSGYQAAVLGELAGEVYTIEIVEELGERARATLADLGYANVHVRIGDGFGGWPEQAPFHGIMVTAAPAEVPPPLVDQLADGGVLVLPVGEVFETQWLLRITRRGNNLVRERLSAVRFVPMVPGR